MSDDLDDDFKVLPFTGLATRKFPLGQVLIADDTADEFVPALVQETSARHAAGDWGEADPDHQLGKRGVRCAARMICPIVSKYRVGDRILQIATTGRRLGDEHRAVRSRPLGIAGWRLGSAAGPGTRAGHLEAPAS